MLVILRLSGLRSGVKVKIKLLSEFSHDLLYQIKGYEMYKSILTNI